MSLLFDRFELEKAVPHIAVYSNSSKECNSDDGLEVAVLVNSKSYDDAYKKSRNIMINNKMDIDDTWVIKCIIRNESLVKEELLNSDRYHKVYTEESGIDYEKENALKKSLSAKEEHSLMFEILNNNFIIGNVALVNTLVNGKNRGVLCIIHESEDEDSTELFPLAVLLEKDDVLETPEGMEDF